MQKFTFYNCCASQYVQILLCRMGRLFCIGPDLGRIESLSNGMIDLGVFSGKVEPVSTLGSIAIFDFDQQGKE